MFFKLRVIFIIQKRAYVSFYYLKRANYILCVILHFKIVIIILGVSDCTLHKRLYYVILQE
jgi:hypothetical protein